MNKKAVVTYFALLVLVIIACAFIYFSAISGHPYATGAATAGSPTAPSTTLSSGGSGGSATTFTTINYNGSISCAAASQYACSGAAFVSRGTLAVNITQYTGSTWSVARVFVLNQTEVLNNQQSYGQYAGSGARLTNFAPGVQATVFINITGARMNFSQPYGEIWARYTAGGQNYTELVGTIG